MDPIRFLSAMAALGLVGVVALLLFLASPRGREAATGVAEGFVQIAEASLAPGTAELRELGCEQAMVGPLGEIVAAVRGLPGAGEQEELAPEVAEMLYVSCQSGPLTRKVPSCGEVARAYGEAVEDAPPEFLVVVLRSGRESCKGIFAPSGEQVRALDEAAPDFSDPRAASSAPPPGPRTSPDPPR